MKVLEYKIDYISKESESKSGFASVFLNIGEKRISETRLLELVYKSVNSLAFAPSLQRCMLLYSTTILGDDYYKEQVRKCDSDIIIEFNEKVITVKYRDYYEGSPPQL